MSAISFVKCKCCQVPLYLTFRGLVECNVVEGLWDPIAVFAFGACSETAAKHNDIMLVWLKVTISLLFKVLNMLPHPPSHPIIT